ncbi:MAG TPA: MMPL family transporter [Dehalococcoidia bacterium]|nr:MMPL family transporter [Dehalococcoidia bacterium]
MERIANFIYNRSRFIIIIVVILTITSAVSFTRFSLDTDFLSFFAGRNPKAVEYEQLNEKYQTGESISIFIEQNGSLLEKENLVHVLRFQEKVGTIEGISLLQSFLPPQISVQGDIFIIDEAFISENYDILKDFIENKYFLKEQFLSTDNQKGTLIALLGVDAVAGDVVTSLKEIVQNEGDLNIALAGNEIIKDTILGYLIRIIVILFPCAILLVLLVFYSVLRRRLLTVLAWIPAGFGALWTFGTIFWSGQELNLVTIISPMFIIVMGSAFGLHYVSHYLENLHKYSDRRQLTVETLLMVGPPIFLAAITTMAGFISLTWSDVIPMREMGIFVTVGIGYAGFLALFFLPALLSLIKLPSAPPEPIEGRLTKFVLVASRQRIIIVVVFVAIVAVSAFYIPKLEVVSDQLMFFKDGSEIRENFAKVEEHFGGALPLTGEIESPHGLADLSDYEFANDVLATERELESLPGIKSAFSIFDLVKGMNKMLTGEDAYPQDPQVVMGVLMQVGLENMGMWVSDDGMRVTIRTQNFDSGYIAELDDFVAGDDNIRVITGMPLLFDEMNRLVVESQVRSLGLALGLIFLMLLITLRRIGAALAGMLPIAITIIAILGMLSMADFNLNIMTANLSAICIGVGVDYSVHLISGIYYFRKRGMDSGQSVDSALASVSRPVLANALGLAIGLSVLFFSPLRLHIHAASVMWVAMVVSSMAALLLIPIFYRRGGEEVREVEPQIP